MPIINGADLATIPASGAAQWTADTPSNLLNFGSDLDCNESPSVCSTSGWGGGGITWPATNFDTINVTASGASNVHQAVTVSPSTQYTFSFQAKAGTLATPKYSVYDVTHGADIVSATSYAGSINGSTFSTVSVTFTTPAGCTSINVYLERDSVGTGTVFVTHAQLVPGSSVVADSIYYGFFSANPNQIFRDNVRLNLVGSKSLLATGDWWGYSNGQAYYFVYVYDNPVGHTVEASERPYDIYDFGKNYITVSNLETDKSGNNVVTSAPNTSGMFFYSCDNVLISGVLTQWNLVSGIRVDTCTNAEVTQSTAAHNGDSGFEGVASPGLLFDHLTAHNNAEAGTAAFGFIESSAGIKFNDQTTPVGTNMTVQYSTSYNNGVGMPAWFGLGIWADTVADGFTAKYNNVYGNNYEGIRAEADSAVNIIGNVVYNTLNSVDGTGISIAADNSAIPLTNSTISNNTSFGNAGLGLAVTGAGEANGCVNNKIINNIAFGATVWWQQLWVTSGCENSGTAGSGNVYTNNSFGAPGESLGGGAQFIRWGSSYYSTYAAWEAATGNCGTTGCSHSVQSDPLFISTTTPNFALQSTSPAIDAGVNLGSTYQLGLAPGSTWPSSVSTLNQNANGAGWDIGAYVYTQSTAPAVSISTPSSTGTVTVTATASATSPAAISSVQFYLDGSLLGSSVSTSSPSYSWNTTGTSNGSHSLTAVALDTYNNVATSSPVTVTINNVAATPTPTNTGGGFIYGSGPLAPGYVNTNPQPTTVSTTTTTVFPATQSSQSTPSAPSASSATPLTLTKNHSLWDTGADIKTLQQWLNSNGFTIATTGAGSLGNETSTFGTLTYKALIKFQTNQGLPQTGYLGPLTRTAILGFK